MPSINISGRLRLHHCLQLGLHRHLILDNLILNAPEDNDLFEGFVVGDDAHRVVVDVFEAVTVDRELKFDPDLLVQQEQVDVV